MLAATASLFARQSIAQSGEVKLGLLVPLRASMRVPAKSAEPWMTQSAINAYGEMWLHKAALEKAGKVDREAVAEAVRTIDLTVGAAKYFAGGRVKFDDKGRRIGAGLYIAQWQGGKAIAVYPDDIALARPIWPKT